MKCKVCGGFLNGQEVTCPHCGAELAAPPPAPPSKEPTFEEKILKRAKLFRALSVLFGCGALLWMLGGPGALILNIPTLKTIYFFCGMNPSILLSLAGLILGFICRKDADDKKSVVATVGVVLSFVTLGGYLFYRVVTLVVVLAA